jgi:hypothetical protein
MRRNNIIGALIAERINLKYIWEPDTSFINFYKKAGEKL